MYNKNDIQNVKLKTDYFQFGFFGNLKSKCSKSDEAYSSYATVATVVAVHVRCKMRWRNL